MSLFIDATTLVSAVTDGPRRAPCRQLLFEIAAGGLAAVTSTLVIEQLWTIEVVAGQVPAGTAADAFEIFPAVMAVDEWVMQSAFTLGADGASPTHRIHAATCRAHRLTAIVSADAAYDEFGWLARIEPDEAGIGSVLQPGRQ